VYVYSLNRETTLTGKHDTEAHEFRTGTHSSCSEWSTGHHLAMLRAYLRTGGMDKDRRSRDWSELLSGMRLSLRLVGSVATSLLISVFCRVARDSQNHSGSYMGVQLLSISRNTTHLSRSGWTVRALKNTFSICML